MNNPLVKDLPASIKEQIEQRVEQTEAIINDIQDRTTLVYLRALMGLKYDYEQLSEFEKADKLAQECLDLLLNDKVAIEEPDKSDYIVSCYDTRARCGDFESFCIALEWNRPINKQFYLPRRRLLKKYGVVQGIQDLIDDKLDLLVLNMPPRVGKTTVGLFLQIMLGGLSPDESILAAGHSVGLIQSFYNEVMNIITDPEYRYHEIFPNNKIVNKSAEYLYFDLNKTKRFHTYNYVSIESGGTGKVQAERLLYCDDLVKDVEQANNPDRLEKLYHNYTGTIKDRKIQRLCKDGVYRPCPEIHINTPWSLHDVTSRVVANAYEDDMSRVRIISIPCYGEDGESNFVYDYGAGFNTKYYKDMEIAEDPVIFSAKYLMKPIEREGRPFTTDQLTFYTEKPNREPDQVVAYNDVAHGGEDFMSMPIGYVYGNEVYIDDVLFVNKLDPDKTRPLVCQKIIENNVTRAGFEQNNGGKLYSDLITGDLKRRNYRCNITTHQAPTNQSKLNRILSCQSDIKGIATEFGTYRIYFKTKQARKDNKEYNDFMHNLCNWSSREGTIQRTQHDDAPDSLAGLITNVLNGAYRGKAKSIDSRGYLY